jgi:hypothetical protein
MVAVVALVVALATALAGPLPTRRVCPRAPSPALSARPRPKFVGTKMGITVEVTQYSNLDIATVKVDGLPFGEVSGTALLDSERLHVVFEPTFRAALRSCHVKVLGVRMSECGETVDVRTRVLGLPMTLNLRRVPAL